MLIVGKDSICLGCITSPNCVDPSTEYTPMSVLSKRESKYSHSTIRDCQLERRDCNLIFEEVSLVNARNICKDN
jgi:hypothetical protein